MEAAQSDHQFWDWLASDEAMSMLSKAASWVAHKIRIHKISLATLKLPEAAQDDEIRETIQSELKFFLIKTVIAGKKKALAPENDGAMLLARSFVNHLKDLDRASPSKNLFRYVYHRFRKVIGTSDDFFTRPIKRSYSLYSRKIDSIELGPIDDEDLAQIPWPPNLAYTGTYSDIKWAKDLLPLAGCFWEGIAHMAGQAVWIAIRLLVRWVDRFVPLSAIKTETIDTKDIPPPENLIEREGDEMVLLRSTMAGLAEPFIEQLSEKQIQAFFLHEGMSLKQEDVAREMGLKKASGANYHISAVNKKIDTFVRGKGLISDNHDQSDRYMAVCAIFKMTLVKTLKSRLSL